MYLVASEKENHTNWSSIEKKKCLGTYECHKLKQNSVSFRIDAKTGIAFY